MFSIVVLGGGISGLLTLVVLGVGWWRWARRGRSGDGPRWLAPLLAGLAVLPAEVFVVRAGLPSLWPASTAERLPHVALALGAIGAICAAALRKPWRWLGLIGLSVAAGGGLWAGLVGLVPGYWTGGALAIACASGAAAVFAVAWIVERAAAKSPASAAPIALFLAFFGASIVLIAGGHSVLAQLAGGVAAMLASAALVGVAVRGFTLSSGGTTVVLGLLAWLLLVGHMFAVEFEPDNTAAIARAALVGATPLAVVVAAWGPGAKMRSWARLAAVAALAVVLSGAAAWHALATARPQLGAY